MFLVSCLHIRILLNSATAQEVFRHCILPQNTTATFSNQFSPAPFTRDAGDDVWSGSLQLAMGSGKPFPPQIPDVEAFVVEFDEQGDPWLPYEWPSWTKYVLAIARASNLTNNQLQTIHFTNCLLRYIRRILRQCTVCLGRFSS